MILVTILELSLLLFWIGRPIASIQAYDTHKANAMRLSRGE
jgi:hypothetical protein